MSSVMRTGFIGGRLGKLERFPKMAALCVNSPPPFFSPGGCITNTRGQTKPVFQHKSLDLCWNTGLVWRKYWYWNSCLWTKEIFNKMCRTWFLLDRKLAGANPSDSMSSKARALTLWSSKLRPSPAIDPCSFSFSSAAAMKMNEIPFLYSHYTKLKSFCAYDIHHSIKAMKYLRRI